MGKAEIQEKINRLNREIQSLESNKTLYNNMNSKINDAINQLQTAKNYASQSYSSLGDYYQSKVSTQKIDALKTEHSNINSVIKTLNDEILVASKSKINSINSSISSKQAQIRQLKQELNSIED